jgi:hypothetical protein
MQLKPITSPDAVVPANVALVVVLAVSVITSAGVVRSLAEHAQPLGAVAPVAPFIVITAVQVPLVPLVYVPALPPPTVAEAEHPDTVNFVPPEITVEVRALPTTSNG